MNERIKMALNVAEIIMQIIRRYTDINVIWSWGVRGYGAGYVADDKGIQQPCLVLNVGGLLHTGFVAVYNGGGFSFSVGLFNDDGSMVGCWHHGVNAREVGAKIDELVEKPKDMTDEEYQRLAAADSEYKMLADAFDAMAAGM